MLNGVVLLLAWYATRVAAIYFGFGVCSHWKHAAARASGLEGALTIFSWAVGGALQLQWTYAAHGRRDPAVHGQGALESTRRATSTFSLGWATRLLGWGHRGSSSKRARCAHRARVRAAASRRAPRLGVARLVERASSFLPPAPAAGCARSA